MFTRESSEGIFICDQCKGHIAPNEPLIKDGDCHFCGLICYSLWEDKFYPQQSIPPTS